VHRRCAEIPDIAADPAATIGAGTSSVVVVVINVVIA
jgi:hypothetical protein